MAQFNNRSYTTFRGVNLSEANGVVRFETPSLTPTTTTGERLLYVNSSNQLIFDNGSGTTVIGAGGGGSTPTWETIFAADSTFTVTPDAAFVIAGNRATATDVLRITNIAGASGVALQLTNATTSNKDINGTSGNWSVLGTGVGTFAGLSISGTSSALTTTGAAVWTLLDNSATALSIGAAGATSMLVFDTRNGAEVVKTSATIFEVTSGGTTLTQASNTVSALVVTDNTVTTFGANANSAGVMVVRSTSLTTGALLQLQVTEGTLNGGFFLVGRHVTAGANVYTVGENGATVIAGAAGSNMLTVTAGDVVFSDASITLTDADNAGTLVAVNDTATTASIYSFAGAGTFTGVGANSFFNITASGLTTGTALTVIANTATTSVGVVDISATGLTSGSALRITTSTANFTTGAKAISVDLVAATAGNGLSVVTTGIYTGTGLLIASAGAMTTGVLLSLTSTTGLTSGSLIRATSSTAGAIATNGAISFSATGNYTSASRVGFLNVAANTTTGGVVAHLSGTAITDGTILSLEAVEATLTTGLYIQCFDGAANDFSVAKYGATTIAGSAAGTAALTLTAGDAVLTSGNLTLTNGFIKGTPQAIVNANTAIDVTHLVTTIANNAPSTHAMADGVVGQIKTIVCTVYTGDAVITPSNFVGTTITLNAAGDSWTGIFVGTEWTTLALGGTAAVA